MRSDNDDLIRSALDDGFHIPPIKRHSLEKIARHNYYARMFATGMKAWSQRAYVGLYSGSGFARVEETGEIIETTALAALRLPFTHYVFVDSDRNCTVALEHRSQSVLKERQCRIVTGDVNDSVQAVRSALPKFDRKRGLLSFCFVDPFSAALKFKTIAALGQLRMDFLILLMLGFDARLNFRRYYDDPTSTRIADLIDCPDWRNQFDRSSDRNVVRFLCRKFDDAMIRLGYRPATPEHYHRVNVQGKGVMQYMLVLYSKHKQGQEFWEKSLRGLNTQMSFPMD